MKKARKALYKLVVETPHYSFVYRRSNNKEKLEDLAIKVSLSKRHWKFVVVPDSFIL